MTNLKDNPYRLDSILESLPTRIPALPYWLMTRGAFTWELLQGGYRIRSKRDESLVRDIYNQLHSYYWSSIDDIGKSGAGMYADSYKIIFGDEVAAGQPELFPSNEEKKTLKHSDTVHLGREEADEIILVWPITYPFLWTTYRDLLKALESVQVTILVPGSGWADFIHRYLTSHHISGEFKFMIVQGLIDIWVQDFVPILTIQGGELIAMQTGYSAPGTDDFLNYRETLEATGQQVAYQLGARLHCLPLIMDWGALVYYGNKAVMHGKPRTKSEKQGYHELAQILKDHLSLDVTFIEPDPLNPTGHVDGTVRFVNEETVLLGRWEDDDGLADRQEAELAGKFKVISLPRVKGRDSLFATKHESDAFGCYLNYIELRDRLIVPVYGIEGDGVILKIIEHTTGKLVTGINCSLLAAGGGGLRCITKSIRL